MENLVDVGLMSYYYTQLYIVVFCHFKLENALGSYKSGN